MPPRSSTCAGAIRLGVLEGVELWRIDLDVAGAGVDEVLTGAERERATRFAFERDRRHFVGGRAATHRILADRLGVRPGALALRTSVRGKPHLSGGPPFSYSRSGATGLLALGGERELGVDLERIRDVPDAAAVAARFFTPAEQAWWRAAGGGGGRDFLRAWTRKEAALKAMGVGLDQEEPGRLLPAGSVELFDVDLVPGHAAALAVFRGAGGG